MALPSTILVLDTETTGLPLWRQPLDHPDQPHIVQLAFVVYYNRRPVHTQAMLVSSPFTSQPGAEQVHKKSMPLRQTFGVPYSQALQDLTYYWNQCDLVVSHNLAFDLRMIARATRFLNTPELVPQRQLCTMLLTTELMRLPGPKGWKWPRLSEAWEWCFPSSTYPAEDAHDALNDVRACASVLFALDAKGHIGYDTDWDRYYAIEEPARRTSLAPDGTLGVRQNVCDQHSTGGRTESPRPLDGAEGDGNPLGCGGEAEASAREPGMALRGPGGSWVESPRHNDETDKGDGL